MVPVPGVINLCSRYTQFLVSASQPSSLLIQEALKRQKKNWVHHVARLINFGYSHTYSNRQMGQESTTLVVMRQAPPILLEL